MKTRTYLIKFVNSDGVVCYAIQQDYTAERALEVWWSFHNVAYSIRYLGIRRLNDTANRGRFLEQE